MPEAVEEYVELVDDALGGAPNSDDIVDTDCCSLGDADVGHGDGIVVGNVDILVAAVVGTLDWDNGAAAAAAAVAGDDSSAAAAAVDTYSVGIAVLQL